MPFVMKTMEEIDEQLGGISDKPHRHNYYTIIWPTAATGKHVIDFKEYPILPNHVFFVSPEQVHQVVTDPEPKGYVILFTLEFLEKNSIRSDFIANLKLFQKSDETPPLPLTHENYILHGDLTIKEVTAKVQLGVEFGGIMKDPWGNEKAGFSINGKINRKDWGLTWNAALESGGVLVSDEVKIAGEVQLVRQA